MFRAEAIADRYATQALRFAGKPRKEPTQKAICCRCGATDTTDRMAHVGCDTWICRRCL